MHYSLKVEPKFFKKISKHEKLVEYRPLTHDRALEWSEMLSWFFWKRKASVVDTQEIYQIQFFEKCDCGFDASNYLFRTVYNIEICGFDDLSERVQRDLFFCGFDHLWSRKVPWIKLFLEDF